MRVLGFVDLECEGAEEEMVDSGWEFRGQAQERELIMWGVGADGGDVVKYSLLIRCVGN